MAKVKDNSASSPRGREDLLDDDCYDNVGPPDGKDMYCTVPEIQAKENPATPEIGEYDDAVPADRATPLAPEATNEDDSVYDVIGPSAYANYEELAEPGTMGIKPSEESDYEVVESKSVPPEPKEAYDDVNLPPARVAKTFAERHERINSLYASSGVAKSGGYDKESEWEDLGDLVMVKMRSVACSHGGPSARKKLGPNRGRSRKVRRQRSRASRKGSTRSSACGKGRARPRNPGAVSDSSDDSNYEEVLVETFEPDNFSTDSESEFPSRSSVPIAHQYDQNGTGHLEAPNREVPPPPVHEPSLGNTLGRPIKMLRRTWSITKSLGRMRKRDQVAASNHQPLHELSDKTQSGVNELQSISLNNNHNHINNNNVELRKYFSFKKPFKKSQALTSSSTFYLDKSASAPDVLGDERPSAEEEPVYYSNDPYREAGLPDEAQPQSPPPRDDAVDDQVAVDHYSVLAEEPLYQFYIESTLKAVPEPYEVASSDYDGYETVEELAPTSATTDLAKPGHRTLWQETPRVKNSALLRNRLSKAELKLQEAKFEILTSEASYLISLRVLQKEFAEDRDLRQFLGPEEESCLFDNVPGVLVASEHFLAEMEFAWDRDVMLGRLCELVVGHAERCAGVYVDYCSNQVNFDARLKELQTRKPCLEALARIQARPVCYGQRLDSFLLLPMQRITRLPLLAEAVLASLPPDHIERSSWEAALKAFQNIVVKCNEGARRVERRNEMDALVRKLEYPAKVQPVDLTDRELIRSGMVVQLLSKHDKESKLTFGRKAHKTPLHLVLLTDYLLVTKLKPNSNEDTYSVVDTCKRDQVVLESVPDNSPFAGKHALLLTLLDNHAGQRVEYVLACANNTERERWLDAVSPPKTVAEAEALYAPIKFTRVVAEHSYFPRQPDELALQPGDAIKVLRKMEDGWLFGEKLLDGQQGWFPGNFTKEIPSKHARMRNIRV
ncbi:rho guanine nucleotide exchange factor 16 isoform X2 [Copidosoma floridanum]|uniref:rho guanine nucleotide exchange factor 16 isoform X2 n=1 Tax=Copidosoma floridanum TaxID=29053 RepID=UPI0006C9B74A|nr:rho guanine nucleotide exchange factor 16 isoform X2 [Copidosoma floridanum]